MVAPVQLGTLAGVLPTPAVVDAEATLITGISIDSRTILPGDLYVALPGAGRHGIDFVQQAVAAGAAAVLTDQAGADALDSQASLGIPLVVTTEPRESVGNLAAKVYGTSMPGPAPSLFGVTGTNGKTTTTYFLNAIQRSLQRSAGLIGTIEILAGGASIPSLLTTPESTDIHALLALMRERNLDTAAMEVSSHALTFHRVDGVVFDVAGFTNLTQDHLDLHGSMDEYFDTKATLFTPEHARVAVVTVDDPWGRRLAQQSEIPVMTLCTDGGDHNAQWNVTDVRPRGLGSSFVLSGPHDVRIEVYTGLPGSFNVSNAALAVVMVLAAGVDADDLQKALEASDPLSVGVPGRMELISTSPAAVVDFAHNPDALARALKAVRSDEPGSRVIVVFGATGQRDQGKRPEMGAIAASLADLVIITDDDPHDEDAALIRADVLAGARKAKMDQHLSARIEEIFPRELAISEAVQHATESDTILVAGRGHEVWQEVKGVNIALDDRVELRTALTARGFTVLQNHRIES